jgi:Secretion system C-terminal sorting domain
MKKFIIMMIWMLLHTTIAAQYQDCGGAIHVCKKQDIIVKKLNGAGVWTDELKYLSCTDQIIENNMIWFRFNAFKSGSFGFNIYPFNIKDDIDFVLFEVNGSNAQPCHTKNELRCMATGTTDLSGSERNNCAGMTGMQLISHDITEGVGCNAFKDNYIADIQLEKGKSYALAINNYTSDGGFLLNFVGDADFGTLPVVQVLKEKLEVNKDIFSIKLDNNSGLLAALTENLKWSTSPEYLPIDANVTKANPMYSTQKNSTIGCLEHIEMEQTKDTLSSHNPNIPSIQLTNTPISQYAKAPLEISDPFPNPTNFETQFTISSIVEQQFDITISNSQGQLMENAVFNATRGKQTYIYNTNKLAPGIYYCTFKTNTILIIKKIIKI